MTESFWKKGALETAGKRRRQRQIKKGRASPRAPQMAVAALIFGFVRPFVVQPFWIPSESIFADAGGRRPAS